MKWISIGGTWKKTNKQVEEDIRKVTREVVERGDAIVSGGALGVDYFATDEALKLDPAAKRIKIFLPTTLKLYIEHYRKRAKEGVITEKQAEDLAAQLETIKLNNPSAIIENKENIIVNEDTYAQRDSAIIEMVEEAIAFHVNQSISTGNNIKKIRQKGIPLKVFTYTIK